MSDGFENALAGLKAASPSASLDILENLKDLDWTSVADDKIELCSEIILFLNSNIILKIFDPDSGNRNEFYELIKQISEIISNSDLHIRSEEFFNYFEKLKRHLDEF